MAEAQAVGRFSLGEMKMDRHTLVQTKNQIDEMLRHGSPSSIRQANSIMVENFSSLAYFALRLTEPKPKPKHTIADNYPAGGLTATEPCMFCENYEALEAENARLLEALERLQTWAKAYPLKVFPEPDFKKVAVVLKAAGLSLDSVSASNMRHVISRVKDITDQALKEK